MSDLVMAFGIHSEVAWWFSAASLLFLVLALATLVIRRHKRKAAEAIDRVENPVATFDPCRCEKPKRLSDLTMKRSLGPAHGVQGVKQGGDNG